MKANNRNPYEVLGLPNRSPITLVKKKYRSIALMNHPDRRPGDPKSLETFEKATVAYHFLLDAGRKKEYDLELKRSERKVYNLKHDAVRHLRRKQRGGVYSKRNISDAAYNEFVDECRGNFEEFFSKVEKLK